MRILIAPDKFKGSLTAEQACAAMAAGVHQYNPTFEVDLCPIADGGEGTLAALERGFSTQIVSRQACTVAGPFGIADPVRAEWLLIKSGGAMGVGGTGGSGSGSGGGRGGAVIELAAAAGLALVPKEKIDALQTSTFGVGEMINAALAAGARTIFIALGGSATCDGGCGLAQALGATFELNNGEQLGPNERAFRGSDLLQIKKIQTEALQARIEGTQFIGLCDVRNPLLGANGAAEVYSPQKGASAEGVRTLGAGLEKLANLYTPEINPLQAGMGAAGGAGFAVVAFLGGELIRGIEKVLEILRFQNRLEAADLVITGEGKLDRQTIAGKALWGVAEQAAAAAKPVLAVVGTIDSTLTAPEQQTLTDYLTDYAGLTELKDVAGVAEAQQQADVLLCRQTKLTLAAFLRPQKDL